jgi:hypothetical protein
VRLSPQFARAFHNLLGGFRRKEKWKSGLNPWCLFLDVVLSFEEITPIKVGLASSLDIECRRIWKSENWSSFVSLVWKTGVFAQTLQNVY